MSELQHLVAMNAARWVADGQPPVEPKEVSQTEAMSQPVMDKETAALAAAELALLSKGGVVVTPAMAAAPVSHTAM